MISRFFIDRPIFASVLSIVITLTGGIAIFSLPIAQYPQVSPPTVQVDCRYPGASAQVVAETVAAPIEQQVNGVEGMLYMSSQCTNDGAYNLTVTFNSDMNLNMAQVLVQNRVALALPLLPEVIKQAGVTTRKRSPDILLSIAVNSPGGKFDQLYLSNYALMHVKDELARLPGISDVTMMGQQDYSMRIWVDPDQLAARDLTAGDVVRALREQNRPVATGQVGQPPVPAGQPIQMTLATHGRLVEPEEFEQIVVKALPDGRATRLKDVARVELGAKTLDMTTHVNGLPSVSLAIFQLPDANALDTAIIVKAKVEELSKDFPEGVRYEIRYDTTPFISESIGEVFKSLRDAIVLVAVVVLLFLQNWRSAVIPLVAVPVAIVGTFAVMAAIGFSINNLTLFGLVLAIGIVVDDAIVVVEAVEHHMEQGLSPRDATIVSMEEVSGPVIAIALVLTAVFVPCAFISGIVGQFFRQFALTIAASTVISAFNSLTLSPALAALLLKPRREGERTDPLPRLGIAALGGWLGYQYLLPRVVIMLQTRGVAATGMNGWGVLGLAILAGAGIGWLLAWPINRLLAWFFGAFNASFRWATGSYTRGVGRLLHGSSGLLTIVGACLGFYLCAFLALGERLEHTLRSRGVFQRLGPRLAAEIEGRGLIKFLTPRIEHALQAHGLTVSWGLTVPDALGWAGLIGAMAALAIAGRLLAWPIDGLLSWSSGRRPGREEGTNARGFTLKVPTSAAVMLVYVGLLYMTYQGFQTTPKGFIPSQDMGYMLVNVQLPDSSSLGRTNAVMDRLEKIAHEVPGVRHTQSMAGQSLLLSASGSNFGSMFIILDEFAKRRTPNLYSEAIMAALRKRFEAEVPDANMTVLGPPPVRGVGRAGGFKLMVEDRGDFGLKSLQEQTEKLAETATRTPGLVGMTSVFRANVPQLFVDVDRTECITKQVALRDLFDTLQIYLGSLYANDFNRFGRTWQVVVQADAKFRNAVEDVKRLKVRNAEGQMVPIGSLAEIREVNGPMILTRYNMYSAAPINGSAAPGTSSGDAIALMERLAADPSKGLLPSMKIEWTELAFLELQAGNTAMVVFGCAVVMVFLVLAAQYESWGLPLAVILVVPLCLLCSIAGVKIAKQDINIFTQIGFVVLVGLACKNAILIVEFARARRKAGVPRVEAALDACRLRLRPIIMTSLAFILGVFPLLIAKGAGAEMRRTLGTTVFSGMVGVTLFGIVLTPVFFVLIDWLGETRLFRSRLMRWFSSLTLGVFALTYVRAGVRRVGAMVVGDGKRSKPAPLPDLDGLDGREDGPAAAGVRADVATRPTNGSAPLTNGTSKPADGRDTFVRPN